MKDETKNIIFYIIIGVIGIGGLLIFGFLIIHGLNEDDKLLDKQEAVYESSYIHLCQKVNKGYTAKDCVARLGLRLPVKVEEVTK